MLNFKAWLAEAKKKKDKKSDSAPTSVSSPIRGANQDQSGFSPSNNTADYTVSD